MHMKGRDGWELHLESVSNPPEKAFWEGDTEMCFPGGSAYGLKEGRREIGTYTFWMRYMINTLSSWFGLHLALDEYCKRLYGTALQNRKLLSVFQNGGTESALKCLLREWTCLIWMNDTWYLVYSKSSQNIWGWSIDWL